MPQLQSSLLLEECGHLKLLAATPAGFSNLSDIAGIKLCMH
jgi:hypothetical protein